MYGLSKPTVFVPLAAVLFAGPSGPVMSAPPSDWATVPTAEVNLFYPGRRRR